MASRLFYRGPALPVLHADYAKQHRVDSAAPLSSASTVEIDAPVEVVWDALARVDAWPRWAPRVEVLRLTEVRPDEPFVWKLNGIKIDARFAVVQPPAELSWTGSFFGYRAVDRNVLEPIGPDRTAASFEESLAGPLLPLLYTATQLRTNHERWLRSLKTYSEKSK